MIDKKLISLIKQRDRKVTTKTSILMLMTALGCVSGSALASGFGVAGKTASTQQPMQRPTNQMSNVNQLLTEAASQSRSGLSNASALSMAPQQGVRQQTAVPSNLRVAQPQDNATGSLGGTGVDKQAFANMVRNMMPLSPSQIRSLRYMFDQSQQAASVYPGVPPKPILRSRVVNLSPGATPPIIRLRAGFITSLVLLDSTGQPWPIQAYDLGDPKDFNVQWNQKGNTLLVQALDSYKPGNLAIILKGNSTPVMVTLMPGQHAVDYRDDLRVPGLGPNAKPSMSGIPASVSPQLINFLDGVPPQGSKRLEVSGGNAQAWEYGKHVYIRTRMTVYSPSWTSSTSSPDGTNVYELEKTPIVLAYQRGQSVQLNIKGL